MQNNTFLKNYISTRPINSLLIFLNTVFLLVVLFTGGFDIENLINLGAIYPPLIIEKNEFYRLFTGIFLHGNIIHFMMNMYVLFYLGGHMEQLIGPRKYLFVYLLSGIASSFAVVYLGKPNTVTVGASGAIFGIMGGLLLLTFLRRSWFSERAIISIRNLMLLNLVITFLVAGISIFGHLGGLVMGILCFFVIAPKHPFYLNL